MQWWKVNKRELPWRDNPTPYQVLVSEIMLQQTQVSRVIPKYHEFIDAFPSIERLASSDKKQLLQVWSGLGYNRRALWLREGAQQIVENGTFPRTVEELRTLKGIGPYTSRSVLIFAFNEDVAAVDTNIRRVFIALGFADENMTDAELQEIADSLLLRGQSSDWHNALMDYGSAVLSSTATGIAPRSKQPSFKGSDREIRGAVIRELTCSERLTLEQIQKQIAIEGTTSSRLEAILEKLVVEKLISHAVDGCYEIA